MSQLQLVPRPTPPTLDGIDLRCCDVATLLGEVRGAKLVVADPPWQYDNAGTRGNDNAGTRGNAEDQYDLLRIEDIVEHVDAAWDSAAPDSYLALWCTWPKLWEWSEASRSLRWAYISGGAWTKTHGIGVGFHWRGDSEPLLLYRKGKPKSLATIRNAHSTPRSEAIHSEKPLGWARDHVRAWCSPGGTVLDLYAGMAPYARAAHLEGRRYVGAEIDQQRHADALGLLAGVRVE